MQSNTKSHLNLRWLVEGALMIAIATVLNEFTKVIPMPFGGGVTICSMLPLVLVSFRFGWRRGLLTAGVFSVLQLIFGMDNVAYATSAGMAAGIILLDYIVPYTVIGLAGAFKTEKLETSYVLGIVVTFALRLLCHFITGWWIWDALWPNEFGMVAPLYSLAYNGSYMLGEMVLSSIVAVLLCKTALRKYMEGGDLN